MTQSEAREAILGRIRHAVKRDSHGGESNVFTAQYRQVGALSAEERLALFTERLQEYDAQVIAVEASGVAAAVGEALRGSDVQGEWVVADGFPAEWLGESVAVLPEMQAGVDELNRCAGVVTTCTVGIALTGTLVLQHGAGEGKRRTTLVPDRHLCVVRDSQVVETVPEAFARLANAATRPLTFISGPSATADIEMTRIRGVHGPRQLIVVLVRE